MRDVPHSTETGCVYVSSGCHEGCRTRGSCCVAKSSPRCGTHRFGASPTDHVLVDLALRKHFGNRPASRRYGGGTARSWSASISCQAETQDCGQGNKTVGRRLHLPLYYSGSVSSGPWAVPSCSSGRLLAGQVSTFLWLFAASTSQTNKLMEDDRGGQPCKSASPGGLPTTARRVQQKCVLNLHGEHFRDC